MSKNIIIVGLILSVLSLLSGCLSVSPTPKDNGETIVIETADLLITLDYIGREELIERHGRNDARLHVNPYVDFPAIFTKKRIIVFNMRASTEESEVEFKLDNIDLRIDDKRGDAKSDQYLLRIWSHYNQGTSKQMKETIDETILDKEFIVGPNSPAEGYLVFAENYPEDGGSGLLSFYLTTPGGDSGTLEQPIYFTPKGFSGTKDENSGLFSE